ncbi:hypothetical protein [Streptomyces sp. CBMA152]|uniref:hypothetical protein n=1 Tax=Streptomyces sp. CBMA152 TaxID=1896312 RepID=UPI001660E5E7|nr:hypothetical protein [Streptomyces sp. CBMA152]
MSDESPDTDPGAAYGRARALMDQALAVVEGSAEPALRYELAQTWRQMAALLEDVLHEEEDPESAESIAMRAEMVRLLDQAAAVQAEFGADGLG